MEDHSTVNTLPNAVALFETVGMPARKLAVRTRRKYWRDQRDLPVYLVQRGIQHPVIQATGV